MKYLLGALALLAAWFLFRGADKMPSEMLPEYTRGVKTADSYVGGRCLQDRCLTIVVAPWCPACQRAKPTIEGLREQLESEGRPVSLVIAMDKPEALEREAATFEKPVVLDVAGRFYKRAKVKGVPYFAVTNRKGEVLEKLSGAYPDVALMRQQLGI